MANEPHISTTQLGVCVKERKKTVQSVRIVVPNHKRKMGRRKKKRRNMRERRRKKKRSRIINGEIIPSISLY